MERNLPDTGEAGASRNYPDTGEPEPRRNYPDTGEPESGFQKKPVVLEPVAPEQEVEQEQGPVKTKGPAKEPTWLTVVYTIFGFVVVYLLLRGLWLFVRS